MIRGPQKCHFVQKYIFEKTAFFGLFAFKMRQNEVYSGVYGANFGFLRVPYHLGTEIMQKKLEKNFGLFWPKRTWKISGLGPKKIDQNRPKWAQQGFGGRFWLFWDPF